jgi:hypothetical protein
VLASILLIAGATGAALDLAQNKASPPPSAGSHAGTNQPFNEEAAIRARAVTWIMGQVSRSAFVACDTQVCADLARKGFQNLKWLWPQSYDPLGANLVVATAAVRAQYGKRLASVYAPAVIASFGSGAARIDIRLEPAHGTAQYRKVAPAAARARKAVDAQLLTNKQLTFSATAKTQLRRGEIDPRLPQLLVALANRHPLLIVDFSSQSPGGGPASLLRWVDLAAADPAAHLTPAAYLSWIQGFINAQRAQYRPERLQVTLPTGQAVLRIGYGAPSPLG